MFRKMVTIFHLMANLMRNTHCTCLRGSVGFWKVQTLVSHSINLPNRRNSLFTAHISDQKCFITFLKKKVCPKSKSQESLKGASDDFFPLWKKPLGVLVGSSSGTGKKEQGWLLRRKTEPEMDLKPLDASSCPGRSGWSGSWYWSRHPSSSPPSPPSSPLSPSPPQSTPPSPF